MRTKTLNKDMLRFVAELQSEKSELEADLKSLALMVLGKSETMFESENDYVNVIAEYIRNSRRKIL